MIQVICRQCSNLAKTVATTSKTVNAPERINQAMVSYLEKVSKRSDIVAQESEEFEVGRRHLANIMNIDPLDFTQSDIDAAIEYLLPSGLQEKAKPIFKHPAELYPKQLAAQFDMSGRPFHFLFYTGKTNFYQIMHDAVKHLDNVKRLEDKMWRQQESDSQPSRPSQSLNLYGSEWIKKDDLRERTLERISDEEYAQFILLMDRLAGNPYSYIAKDFIMSQRNAFQVETGQLARAIVFTDAYGNQFIDSEGRRKSAVAKVRVWIDGTGRFTINNSPLSYFRRAQERTAVMYPLLVSKTLRRIDVEAHVWFGGLKSQAGAIRYALAVALTGFVDSVTIDHLRIAGLLTEDIRYRERKKPGQAGARRKYTWKRR